MALHGGAFLKTTKDFFVLFVSFVVKQLACPEKTFFC
jgi:hypothetical protein